MPGIQKLLDTINKKPDDDVEMDSWFTDLHSEAERTEYLKIEDAKRIYNALIIQATRYCEHKRLIFFIDKAIQNQAVEPRLAHAILSTMSERKDKENLLRYYQAFLKMDGAIDHSIRLTAIESLSACGDLDAAWDIYLDIPAEHCSEELHEKIMTMVYNHPHRENAYLIRYAIQASFDAAKTATTIPEIDRIFQKLFIVLLAYSYVNETLLNTLYATATDEKIPASELPLATSAYQDCLERNKVLKNITGSVRQTVTEFNQKQQTSWDAHKESFYNLLKKKRPAAQTHSVTTPPAPEPEQQEVKSSPPPDNRQHRFMPPPGPPTPTGSSAPSTTPSTPTCRGPR